MKDAKQCEALFIRFLQHAGATTPEDHACLGAMLTVIGVSQLIRGHLNDEEIEFIVEQGKRSGRGQRPLPMGEEPPE